MSKEAFLRLQYLRMINSDEFVVEQWRSSMDRFIRDLWDRTPGSPGRRFLQPVDCALGFSPENVEWQFPKAKRKRAAKVAPLRIASEAPLKPTKAGTKAKVTRATKARSKPTKAETKAEEAAAREARRQAIAEEFHRWEQRRINRR
ncbi:UNVERIFIED_ORG: hypothetical protein GGD47_002821 [Rhizobium etli]